MPWNRAKALPPPNNSLFDACFRIQREACEAAGRHIPLIVENVRGAQPWVGRARWNFGSFYLWGDVPALMPTTFKGFKTSGMNWSDQTKRGQDFTRIAGRQAEERDGIKNSGGSWFGVSHGKTHIPNNARDEIVKNTVRELSEEGVKVGGDWFSDPESPSRTSSSGSPARKRSSAMIAKIPAPLARYIARTFKPRNS